MPTQHPIKTPSRQNQSDVMSKRSSFRKQIRKSIVNHKLQSLRKILIIDANLCRPLKAQNWFQELNDKRIQDLLKALDKFNQKLIPKCEYSQIKKFSQKLDAAVIVQALINKLITEEDQLKSLQRAMNNLSIGQIEQEHETGKGYDDLQRIEELKQMSWQPKTQNTKLQILKQVWQMSLLIKIDRFLQCMAELTQSSDYPSQIKYSQLIPMGVVKWLYFYDQNMRKHMQPHTKFQRNNLNSSSTYDDQFILRQSYNQVAQRMIQFFSLEQINEVFFEHIYKSDLMKDLIHPKISLTELELEENYIDCSPYQLLIQSCDQSQNILINLRNSMKIKIQQGQRFLRIENIKIQSIQLQGSEYFNFLRQHQLELFRSMKLLSMLEDYLERKKNQQVMESQEKIEDEQFLKENLDL